MIQIDEQEKYVWIACKDGWRRYAGHTAIVDGIQVSIVLAPTDRLAVYDLAFSDLESGASLLRLQLSIIDVALCKTKEQAYVLYEEKAEILQARIRTNGIETMKYKAACMKENFEAKFGPMPEIEILTV